MLAQGGKVADGARLSQPRLCHVTMQILHLSALPVWSMDGKGGMPSLRETLRGHVRAGHQVILVLPKVDLFRDVPAEVSVRGDEGYEVHLAPCRWARPLMAVRRFARQCGGGKEMFYPLRWLLNLTMCVLLTGSLLWLALRLRWRERRHFDLVYAHNQYAALAGWLAGKLFRAPNVTRLYGTFLADLMKRPLVVLRYPVAAAGYLVPHSLLIVANDGTRGDEVARRLKIDLARFRFWQNGVDLPDTPPTTGRADVAARFAAVGLRLQAKWVFTCSRLSYWKRMDRMIRALKGAREAGADCQLIIAGAGVEEQSLRALADELRVADNVVWLGAVEHAAIWELMHVADVFMITNNVTNRCNPLYEAICARLPVVSVIDPSTGDLLQHEVNALLAEKDDTAALGQHLARLCNDAALAARLRDAQEEKAKGLWSWSERMAVEVKELETLVARNKEEIGDRSNPVARG